LESVDEPTRTINLLLPGNVRAEVTSTRSEKYDKPGKPPEITPGTIYDDMRRRDFTVNAMALSLNPGSRGLLTDPFNGMADIEAKVLRVLHNYAFYEEPSRLVRATRLSARFPGRAHPGPIRRGQGKQLHREYRRPAARP
jgi:tRNA nucleotidyltransferase/poly(A) polymerase